MENMENDDDLTPQQWAAVDLAIPTLTKTVRKKLARRLDPERAGWIEAANKTPECGRYLVIRWYDFIPEVDNFMPSGLWDKYDGVVRYYAPIPPLP